MDEYYKLFPKCKQCEQIRLHLNTVDTPLSEETLEKVYAKHLMEEHKLTRLEICERTGVFIC